MCIRQVALEAAYSKLQEIVLNSPSRGLLCTFLLAILAECGKSLKLRRRYSACERDL